MSIRNTTLEQWRVFQSIIAKGSFLAAAEDLHKSQSTVSYAIKNLQQQLGVKLFKLVGKKAVLTNTGQLFLEKSKLLMEQVKDLELLALNIEQHWEHEINLVVESAVPKSLLSQALQQFEKVGKGCQIQLTESVLSGTEEAIKNSKNDIVLTPFVPANFFAEPLIDLNFIAVCAINNPLCQQKAVVTQQQLKNALQIVVRDSGQKQPKDAGWLGAKHRWTVSSLEASKTMVMNSLGIAWLPEHMIQNELKNKQLAIIPMEYGKKQHAIISMVMVKQDLAGPASSLLAKILLTVFQKDKNLATNA